MFLAVDIGNTNIKLGVFDGTNLISKLTLPTPSPRNPSGSFAKSIPATDFSFPITAAFVCSVVPEVNDFVGKVIEKWFSISPRFVANKDDFGLTIRFEPLENAGTDRIVGAFAAAELHGVPCVVASFGTALTVDAVDAVDAHRVLLGGIIAPGPRVMSRALSGNTSRLPEVEVTEFPSQTIQTSTVEAIKSGILNGYLGMAERLINLVKSECDPSAKVIATGGYAELVGRNTHVINTIEPNLILKGLQLCYDRWHS